MKSQLLDNNSDMCLSFNQEGRLLHEWLAIRRSVKVVPNHLLLGLSLKGQLDIEALNNAINVIISRHSIFRTAIYCVPPDLPLERFVPLPGSAVEGSYTKISQIIQNQVVHPEATIRIYPQSLEHLDITSR